MQNDDEEELCVMDNCRIGSRGALEIREIREQIELGFEVRVRKKNLPF